MSEKKVVVKNQSRTITGVRVKLIGVDGNAFNILGLVKRAMKEGHVPVDVINQYQKEATSGDYDNLLQVTMKYVKVM